MREIVQEQGKKLFVLDSNGDINSPHELDEYEYITLPSKGYFYKGKFKNIEYLKVRKLNWGDEDILTTKSFYDNGTIFDELLDRVIVDENGFKAKMLVPVDKDSILIWLRIGAFGRNYTIKKKCPNPKCKFHNKTGHDVTWDLGSFDMPDINPKYKFELEEHGEIECLLPVLNKKIKLSIPSIGREREIKKTLEQKKEKTGAENDFIITGKLLSCITAVENEEQQYVRTPELISNFIYNELKSIKDSRFIIKTVKEIDLKVNTDINIVCPNDKCKHSEEGVEMPMSIYFFWPEFDES